MLIRHRKIFCILSMLLLLLTTSCNSQQIQQIRKETQKSAERNRVVIEKIINVKDFERYENNVADDYIAIQSAINAAKTQSLEPTVFFEKKVYHVGQTINIEGFNNAVIDGQGAILVFKKLTTAINILNSRNLKLKNFIIDYDPLPYTQGIITAFDPDGKWFEIKIDKGYPNNPLFVSKSKMSNIVDIQLRSLKLNSQTTYNIKSVEQLSQDTFRINCNSDPKTLIPGVIKLGDSMVMWQTGEIGVFLSQTENCLLDNIIIYSSPGFGIKEDGGEGGNHYNNIAVKPGPKPAYAERERLKSVNKDAFHSAHMKKGPIVENCFFELMGDDGVNVHGSYHIVAEINDNKILLISPKNTTSLEVGDRVEFMDKDTSKVIGQTKIFKMEIVKRPELNRKAEDLWKDRVKLTNTDFFYQIELADSVYIKAGDIIVSLDRVGEGAIIRNNTIRGDRARGIVMKAPNSLIENNLLERNCIAGIVLQSEAGQWMESHYPSNVIIRGNQLIYSGIGSPTRSYRQKQLGAITILVNSAGRGFSANREIKDITIENNIVKNSAVFGLLIANASGVKIINNQFLNTNILDPQQGGGIFEIKPSSAVLIGESEQVELKNNIIQPGEYANEDIVIDASADSKTIRISNSE